MSFIEKKNNIKLIVSLYQTHLYNYNFNGIFYLTALKMVFLDFNTNFYEHVLLRMYKFVSSNHSPFCFHSCYLIDNR